MTSVCLANASPAQLLDSQIKVGLINLSGGVLELEVDPSMTLLELKQNIDERWRVPVLCQQLLCGEDVITDSIGDSAGMQGRAMIRDYLLPGQTSISLTLISSQEQVYQLLAHMNPEVVCLALQTIRRMPLMHHERAIEAVKAVLDEHSLSLSSEVHLAAAEVLAMVAERNDGKGLDTLNKLVHLAVRTDSLALLLYPYECWDEDLVLAAIPKKRGYAFVSFWNNEKVKKFFDQKQFVMAAVEKSPLILEYASEGLKADKELVLRAVQLNWQALQYASYQLQSDQDIVNIALAQSEMALQFAGARIKSNRELILEVVKKNPQALKFASKKLQADDVLTAHAYAAFVNQQCSV
mmetsp:Transcript_6310/g.10651  ORF Transcript_6310/g.10651 Transcript_6310/m.10651 type:complete len:352 (-) Transcript_6310:129-1184(-)